MDKSQKPSVLELVKQAGLLRPRDLDQYGIPREYLSRLRNRGMLRQVGRGLYTLPDAEWTAHHSLAEACKRVTPGRYLSAFCAAVPRTDHATPVSSVDGDSKQGTSAQSGWATGSVCSFFRISL